MDNLAMKRAIAKRSTLREWIGGNLGTRITTTYPSVYLSNPNSRAEILSLSLPDSSNTASSWAKSTSGVPFQLTASLPLRRFSPVDRDTETAKAIVLQVGSRFGVTGARYRQW
ncbi:hypothetical protein Q31b_57050 [Novipirellula aureliae]|uniref:Uncharacterized protein n=2 Tax=Novipirellula aureliae TaxID=2527966 RepID=A0A5C6DAA3_9BACT|nr:hypothetical protein Q31b_57050 [Novipirellula aureliae]